MFDESQNQVHRENHLAIRIRLKFYKNLIILFQNKIKSFKKMENF